MKRSTAQIASLIVVALFMTMLSCSSSGGDGGGGGTGGTTGGSGGGTGGTTGSRQWTYMVYMGADNNLSDAGLGDLNEMEKVGSSASVAIVVQAEFSTKYTQRIDLSQHGRILVENDNDPNAVNLSSGTSSRERGYGQSRFLDGIYQLGESHLSGGALCPGDLGPWRRLESEKTYQSAERRGLG